MPKRKAPDHWRNAIVRYADEDPSSLLANPQNWRIHPREQTAALTGSLSELGWIAPVIVNETTQHVVDGHARIGEAIARNEPTVPVAYVRLTEEQERVALATFDPISAMAGTDQKALDDLLSGLQVENQQLVQFLATLGPPTDPNAEWQGMPGFEHDDLTAHHSIIVHLKDADAVEAFARLIQREIKPSTKTLWFPDDGLEPIAGAHYDDAA